ncbi:hypothetical protein ASPWEDRAFT_174528 [Aspergillus wentii DTO 134E9]|uniref:Uncharacterized protein n=1 Tax=Aspergillus wentii DTO 134E9 TaxID=1073089 RepID=A0A1L9RDX9_ASPWE|nr:uncharacterized protein ASPWEDRAFT_174528 [Aspergillus wentii DTO 134E9]KAI9933371.1 hypothetical protein MW887_007844 [Aspergillus wentii]OJJ33104.1 hypothetical protein ASPWEDRAFT_174528 [Aspergillus wentii DTO 134E9]
MSLPEPASSPQILRIPRTDEPDTHVLLYVSRFDATLLDLNIAATEGETPYTTTVRQSRLKNLRAKNYQGSDDEWTQTVSYVLGQLPASAGIPDWASGIEAFASISGSGDDDKEMVLTIRKKIEAITQKLGTIILKQDDEQAIELFDWSGIAVARASSLEHRLSSLNNRFLTAENTIHQLSRQLEELINAKSQHENQIIADFGQLLNEKKLKIRNQQRLLASAKVDPIKVSEIRAATLGRYGRSTDKGQRLKRAARDLGHSGSESEDEFEKMEVDNAGYQDSREEDQNTDGGQRSTPQPLEEEDNTATDEEFSPPSPPVKKGKRGDVQGQGHKISSCRPVMKEPAPPPPRRQLPFARKNQEKQNQIQINSQLAGKCAEGTAGETDDDEL